MNIKIMFFNVVSKFKRLFRKPLKIKSSSHAMSLALDLADLQFKDD